MAASLFVWLFADEIVTVTGPGLAEAGTADDAVRYLRLLAPTTFLGSVAAILGATCQAERMFVSIVIATVVGPLLSLAFLVFFWGSLALDGLALGTIVGDVIAVVTLLAAMVLRRVTPSPRFMLPGSGLADLARHAAPLSVSRVDRSRSRLSSTVPSPPCWPLVA